MTHSSDHRCNVCRRRIERYRHAQTESCEGCRQRIKRASGRCYYRVAKAIKRGALPEPETLKCADCGAAAQVYDHRDYGRPLEVTPVCRSCNHDRGLAKLPALAA